MTKPTLALLLAAVVLACSQPNEERGSTSASGDTTALVVVDRPTAIGFFPPADSSETEEEGYSEGLAHLGFALDDAKVCLGGDSSQTFLVVDTAVRLRNGTRVDTLRFSSVDSVFAYGVYLVAPGFSPRLVTAIGPGALNPMVAEAIPSYFRRPACRDKS